MKTLIIDTCGAIGSVALADSDLPAVVASTTLPGRTASERLVATIKELMSRPNCGLASLGAVAVVYGPGSFTGVRVGLSAAKGLSEALNLSLIAVSRLAVLAGLTNADHVFALLDAGRGEFYLGEYSGGLRVRETLADLAQVLAAVRHGDSVIVTCEASVAHALGSLGPTLVSEPTAEDAWPSVLRRIRAGEYDDTVSVDANYLRRTDAEIFAKPAAPIPPSGLVVQ